MNCSHCGAPLPGGGSRRCTYCGTLNDVDLRQHATTAVGRGQRPCPRCADTYGPLTVTHLQVAGAHVEIDRCDACHGIFFDPGELEAVLDRSKGVVLGEDHQRMQAILAEETCTRDVQEVAYVKCPDCQKLMHRKNFGARSGVIVDQCRDHGVWLDGGELRRLVEWARAGGQMFDQREQAERKAAEERLARIPSTVPSPDEARMSGAFPVSGTSMRTPGSGAAGTDTYDWDGWDGLGSTGRTLRTGSDHGFDLFDALGLLLRFLR